MNVPFGSVGGLDAPTPPAELDDVVHQVELRVLARLEEWKREELDEHVLRLVEDRLQEETERRSWRRGTEVF